MLKLGDIFILEIAYYDKPHSKLLNKDIPGCVRGPDGKLYVIDLLLKDKKEG